MLPAAAQLAQTYPRGRQDVGQRREMGCNPGGSQEPWPVVIAKSSNSWSRARPRLRRPTVPGPGGRRAWYCASHLRLQRRLGSGESLDLRGVRSIPLSTPTPPCMWDSLTAVLYVLYTYRCMFGAETTPHLAMGLGKWAFSSLL